MAQLVDLDEVDGERSPARHGSLVFAPLRWGCYGEPARACRILRHALDIATCELLKLEVAHPPRNRIVWWLTMDRYRRRQTFYWMVNTAFPLRILLLVPCLAMLAACNSAPVPTPHSVKRTGTWVRPLTERLGPCLDGNGAWGWDASGNFVKFDGRGEVSDRWSLPFQPVVVQRTPDCGRAWILDKARRHLLLVQSGSANLLQTTLRFPVEWIEPFPYEARAWVAFDKPADARTLAIALVSADIDALVPKEAVLPLEYGIVDVRTGTTAKGTLWYALKGNGIAALRPDADPFYHPVKGLKSVDILGLAVAQNGADALLWAIPSEVDGFYVVTESDETLNNGQPYLSDRNLSVMPTSRNSPLVWMTEASETQHAMYPFKAERDTNGKWSVVSLTNYQPLRTSTGAVVEADALTFGGQGSVWLLSPSNQETLQLHARIYQVNTTAGVPLLTATALPQSLLKDHLVSWLAPHRTKPSIAYVALENNEVVEIDIATPNVSTNLRPGCSPVSELATTQERDALWLSSIPRSYLLLMASRAAVPVVEVGTSSMRLGEHVLTLNDSSRWLVKSGGFSPIVDGAHVHLQIIQRDEVIARADGNVTNQQSMLSLIGHERIRAGEVYNVVISAEYSGAVIDYRWEEVQFDVSLWFSILRDERFIALVFLLVPITGICLLFRNNRAGVWSPIYVPALGLIVANTSVYEQLKPRALLEVYVTTGAVLSVFALVSTDVLRILARLRPFDLLFPLLMRIRFVRIGFFGKYRKAMKGTIEHFRSIAKETTYAPQPLKNLEAKGIRIPDDSNSTWNAGAALSDLLADSDDRQGHVIVTAPGGRGKSALLREIAMLLIKHSANGGPVPILAGGSETDIETRLRSELSITFGSSRDASILLDTERLVVLIDGVSQINMSVFEVFVRNHVHRVTFCIATRQAEQILELFRRATDRFVAVEPLPLTEAAAERFVASRAAGQDAPGIQRILSVAGSREGGYSPLVLALACRAPTSESLRGVFASVLSKLLPSVADKTELAITTALKEMCLRSMWASDPEGARYADHRTLDAVSDLEHLILKQGADTGLLIADKREPSMARFFHDIMASYVLACALSDHDLRSVLRRSSGEPGFVRATSTLLGFSGAELFQMLLVVHDLDESITAMSANLIDWAEALEQRLSINDVLTGLTRELQDELRAWHDKQGSRSGDVLRWAVEQCALRDRAAQPNHPAHLGRLHATIALLAHGQP